MIAVTSSVQIDEGEIQLDFVRASGPGGQNVNKVATSVQLRFDVRNSPSLAPEVKERLAQLAGSRMTEEGVLVIEARRFRSQEQNRLDAVQRLIRLIERALERPKARRATRPSAAARAARVDAKKRRGQTKQIRRRVPTDEE